jgi:hypothetical protein
MTACAVGAGSLTSADRESRRSEADRSSRRLEIQDLSSIVSPGVSRSSLYPVRTKLSVVNVHD